MIKQDEIEIFRLVLPEIGLKMRDGHKLRGFVAKVFAEHDEFHNHDINGQIYRYPLIQYKVVGGIPHIIGLKQGADKLLQLEDELNELILDNREIPLFEKKITFGTEPFGCTNRVLEYKFATPWFALNQANYSKYQMASEAERRELLRSVLVGNILAMAKGLGYGVQEKIVVDLGRLRLKDTKFKEQRMIVFSGNFFVNFQIPKFLGIGKSVSRGFGTIQKIE